MKTIANFIGEEVMRTVGADTSNTLARLQALIETKRSEYLDAISKPGAFVKSKKSGTQGNPEVQRLQSELEGLELQLSNASEAEAAILENQARKAQAQYDSIASAAKAKTITASTELLLAPTATASAHASAPAASSNWIYYTAGAAVLGVAAFFILRKRKRP